MTGHPDPGHIRVRLTGNAPAADVPGHTARFPMLIMHPTFRLLALTQDPGQRPAEDVRLSLRRHAAGVQRALIPLERLVELLQIATKHVRPKDNLLECADLRLWTVWANHARPPEDGFK